MTTEAILLDASAVRGMAETICRADKGDGPDNGYDNQPSWGRDRYDLLAEAVLRYVADQHGIPTMEPVPGAGWRRDDGSVAVGDPSGYSPPPGFEPVYRVLTEPEPSPTARAYGAT